MSYKCAIVAMFYALNTEPLEGGRRDRIGIWIQRAIPRRGRPFSRNTVNLLRLDPFARLPDAVPMRGTLFGPVSVQVVLSREPERERPRAVTRLERIHKHVFAVSRHLRLRVQDNVHYERMRVSQRS